MSRRKNKKTSKQHRVNPQNVSMDRILPKAAAAAPGSAGPAPMPTVKKAGKSKNPVATAPETPKAKTAYAAHVEQLQTQISHAVVALRELTQVLSRPADATLAEGGVPRAVREHLTAYATNVLHVDLSHLIEEILVLKGFPLAAGPSPLALSAPGGDEAEAAELDDEDGPVDEGEEEMPRPIELAEGEDAPPHEDEQDPVTPVSSAPEAALPVLLAAPPAMPAAAPVTLPSNWNNNNGNS